MKPRRFPPPWSVEDYYHDQTACTKLARTPILSNAKGHCNSYGKTRAVIPIPPLTNARELSRS